MDPFQQSVYLRYCIPVAVTDALIYNVLFILAYLHDIMFIIIVILCIIIFYYCNHKEIKGVVLLHDVMIIMGLFIAFEGNIPICFVAES